MYLRSLRFLLPAVLCVAFALGVITSAPRVHVSEALTKGRLAVQQQPTEPGINISRQEYEQALAKWSARGGTEYVMVVEFMAFSPYSGLWQIHVSGEQVRTVSFTRASGEQVDPVPQALDFQKEWTVERQFAAIGRALDEEPWDVGSSESEIPFDYRVSFDDNLGYPTLLQVTAAPNPNSGSQIADADYSIKSSGLKVLPSGVPIPGMPTTGNPGP